jgi:ribonuclease HI
MPKAKSQRSLDKWTDEKWGTSDGKPSKGKKRYLPKKAWEDLTPAEKRATNAAKAKGDGGRSGKQHVAQPDKIAKKTAKHRRG